MVITVALVASGLSVGAPAADAASLPSLTVGDVSVWEGDAGSVLVRVPIDLSASPTAPVVVNYTANTGSAEAGIDYVVRKGKLTFRAGSVPSKQVALKILGDTVAEANDDDQVVVRVTSVTGAEPDKPEGGVTIMDDDAATPGSAGPVEVGIGDFSVVEADAGTHVAHMPITLSVPAPQTIKVAYGITCSTAIASSDYVAKAAGAITFKAGQRAKTLPIRVTADLRAEDVIESVTARFSVVDGTAAVRGDGAALIFDDDGQRSVAIMRASVSSAGEEGAKPASCEGKTVPGSSAGIRGADLTPDGRYVAFATGLKGLVADDTNDTMDVFVRDLENHTTERVSLKNDGSQYGSDATHPTISADARYVIYTQGGQLHLRDRVAATTQTFTGSGALEASISADGALVAYHSLNAQTATPVPQGQDAIYVWNRPTNTTSLVTVRSPEFVAPWLYDWGAPVISGNGRYVAFTDGASTLVAGDTNNCADTFVRDLQTGTTERVSVSSSGAQQETQWEQSCTRRGPTISDDGRYIGFSSAAWNLYPGATGSGDLGSGGPASHAYLRDTQTGTTQLLDGGVNAIDSGALMQGVSDDGRYVVFFCQCGGPVPGYPASVRDHAVIWRDLSTGDSLQIGVQNDGTQPAEPKFGFTYTFGFGISADGLTVGFTSEASNLVGDDHNDAADVFVEVITP